MDSTWFYGPIERVSTKDEIQGEYNFIRSINHVLTNIKSIIMD